jgi:hypothetical protein
MLYEYVYELITTLFIDITMLSSELVFFLELFMIFITASLIRFFLIPIFYLFKISASTYRNIFPKTRIRRSRD